ncbi:hypothetical protein [Streptomyces sp. NBC_00299]|uniref:hypothetical protein n=1 Tax=Streptomyces sp. NBC_00299 TaxID=2975705 RepID=UPI002E28F13A|nr:hypothetical protein [Streptomyces sp. NBC_00299]
MEGTSGILVEGDVVTEPEHFAQLRDVKPSETFVRVPRELLVHCHPDLDDVERQLFGARDRHPDGSVAREGSGARPLADWWEHLTAALER